MEMERAKQQLHAVLKRAVEQGTSDIHYTVGLPPVYRIDGSVQPQTTYEPLTEEMMEATVRSILDDDKLAELHEAGETDLAYQIDGVGRFRVNAYSQKRRYSLALRNIPTDVPTIDQLGMGQAVKHLAEQRQGLVLVTGPTGSGKSTTLAAMIRHVNENYPKHIITLEDPIEYVHDHQRSIIHQREIEQDTTSFASGLRAALRQDPDIVLVGELRDLETIQIAITAAETGHLVFGTLHTTTAASTINRIIDVFPPSQQSQIRQQLAATIQGVIAQRLILRAGGGRVAATEILTHTPSISNLIRTEKVHQIQNILQTSRDKGMHTMEMHIQQLLSAGTIDYETAKPFLNEGGY